MVTVLPGNAATAAATHEAGYSEESEGFRPEERKKLSSAAG